MVSIPAGYFSMGSSAEDAPVYEWERPPNVREWTADWYDPAYYQQRVAKNPTGPDKGLRRVERGGAFFLPRGGVTPTIRYNHPPDFHLYFLGFRCARSG